MSKISFGNNYMDKPFSNMVANGTNLAWHLRKSGHDTSNGARKKQTNLHEVYFFNIHVLQAVENRLIGSEESRTLHSDHIVGGFKQLHALLI